MRITSKYPGTCKACGGRIAVGAVVEWSRGAGATHATTADCAAAKAAKAAMMAAAPVLSMKPVADFILAAKTRGLKFPSCRFLAPGGGELRLSLAGPMSKAPGSIQVKINDTWIGRVEPTGHVIGYKLSSNTAVLDTLTAIANDPAAKAKEYGALVCRCSFCNLALTDEGSVEVGYGPVCAKHWGLPHTPKGSKPLTTAVPVTASVDLVPTNALSLDGIDPNDPHGLDENFDDNGMAAPAAAL